MGEVVIFAEEELLPSMREVSNDAGFVWEELFAYPALHNPEDSELIRLAKDLTKTSETEKVGVTLLLLSVLRLCLMMYLESHL